MSTPSPSAPRDHRRWRLLADVTIQGELLLRLVVYWMILQLIPFGTQAVLSTIGNSGKAPASLGPAFYISLLILPILLLDALKFSNRFAGPIVNLRNTLKRLNAGDTSANVKFRPMDYYGDLETPINSLIARAVAVDEPSADDGLTSASAEFAAKSSEALPSAIVPNTGGPCEYQSTMG